MGFFEPPVTAEEEPEPEPVGPPWIDEPWQRLGGPLTLVWGAKTVSQRGIMEICRRNRVLTPDTDDAEKLRG